MQTTFADTIIDLSMTGKLTRFELGTAVHVTNSEGKQEVRLNPTQTVVTPLEGFIRSFGMQEQLILKADCRWVSETTAASTCLRCNFDSRSYPVSTH